MTHLCRVVSGDVDCGRRRQRNVYDKKPQRYAKDNRTAHLTARSDKSVAYVTNNERFYSTFCNVEANYIQTRSIARPLRQQSYLYTRKALLDPRGRDSRIRLPPSLEICLQPHVTVTFDLLHPRKLAFSVMCACQV